MRDDELDQRLEYADPARPAPAVLDAVIDDLVTAPRSRRRRWLRPVVITGGAVMLAGALAAATDLDTYLLSVPPFSTLDEGTVRPMTGLPYVPVAVVGAETDHGEQCKLYLDLGGVTDDQYEAISEYWAAADPTAFAAGVASRLGTTEPDDLQEWDAIRAQILSELRTVVPDIAEGAAPPGKPFPAGEPHLTAVSRTCVDDLEGLGYTE